MIDQLNLPDAHNNTGPVYIGDLPGPVFEAVKKNIVGLESNFRFASKLNSASEKLAGHIANEMFIKLPIELKIFFEKLFEEKITPNNVIFKDNWVNFQAKTEYNPSHTHSGDWSYVVWVKIPYKLASEDLLPNCKNAEEKRNGRFEFIYTSNTFYPFGYAIDVDKSYEGKFVLFKSSLRHTVYPFYTSDDYRISLAGNITINSSAVR